MNLRDKLIMYGASVLAAILAAVLARYGIVVPVPPPPISQQPPTTQPPQPPDVNPDPHAAIVRISRQGVGCSATIIGPRRADGRYWALSAAHCCERVGERWNARFRDGRTTGLVVTAMNKTSDYAWMLTDVDTQIYPYALLADKEPAVNESVWHAGYGVDNPGNLEGGLVRAAVNREGQIEYEISVSSGDSGGGICLDKDGRILSPVCCTTRPGGRGRVWGASPLVARSGMTQATDLDQWTPLPIPTRPEAK